MCESGSSARRERWPSSTRRRFPLAIARQNPHIGSMTPQPDPLEAPPPGPPYRGAREPMFNLPPGTLWLGLRSEEHTYEIQSLLRTSYAIFCLKKNKQNNVKRLVTPLQ